VTDPEDVKGLGLSLAAYTLILGLKLAAYAATGVLALLAEALHTLSDLFVSAFLLIAAFYSRRQADATHMFGYGRAQNAAALVAAVLFLSFTSLELYREAFPRLFQPPGAAYDNLGLALGTLAASMLIAGVPLIKLLRSRSRGAAARAQLIELVNDELGLVAALIGTILIALGEPLGDPLAAIAVATIIAFNGLQLLRENLSFLMGRSPGPEALAAIERAARSVAGVLDVRGLRAEYVGPGTVHAGLRLVVARGTPIEQAAVIAEEVERKVHTELAPGYCYIQMDPAPPGESLPPPSRDSHPAQGGA